MNAEPAWRLRLRHPVEVALAEVAAADHRAHVSSDRVHRDKRRLQRFRRWRVLLATQLPLFDLLQPAADFRLGGLLQIQVERRVDLQPAFVDALPAEPLDELLANLFFEVLAERLLTAQRVAELNRRVDRGLVRLANRSRAESRIAWSTTFAA